MEAIILAGGIGSRLRPVVTDVPKPLAPVAGKPFLDYILQYLKVQGVKRIVLAVGYKWRMIDNYYSQPENRLGLHIALSVETEPLGTGGAIFHAAEKILSDDFFIINGDTFFDIPLNDLYNFHSKNKADITLALKHVPAAGRYGTVECAADGRIVSFIEKGLHSNPVSQINGGVYLLRKDSIQRFKLPKCFSFEKDLLQAGLHNIRAFGKPFTGTFIDIGVPEDYALAQELFKNVDG